TVTYTVYTNNTCTAVAGPQPSPATVTVTNGTVPNSADVSFPAAGTFFWQAGYSARTSNGRATSACTSELLRVRKQSPTIATTMSASTITVGGSVHDSATLTGATGTAGGTVTYTVYTTNACTTPAGPQPSPAMVTVTNGTVPNSADTTFPSAGTFFWQASY